MKKFFANLVTLPYRMWMLWLGRYVMCDDCYTITSGGFGYKNEEGEQKFSCMDCTIRKHDDTKHRNSLSRGMCLDPAKRRKYD